MDQFGYLHFQNSCGVTTTGGCRYRQAIPVGIGGRLDVDTNFGIRKAFLPQGSRRYRPIKQPTTQQVMYEKISAGPITVMVIGAFTNLAIFLMRNPHLKKNVEHIFVMGGGVRSKNPTGCCPKNSTSCTPQQCGDPGNLYTAYSSNPYAEFNIFADPFAAYQVFHSGIPITLIPLDATNTIPINEEFFNTFEKTQNTYEAQYTFQSLKMARDTWFGGQFYKSYFMWDSFTSGVAVSIMRNSHKNNGENEFAEMEYMNITVVTSNKPYGISDGSNPLFDGLKVPKFNLKRGGVHSGHVQTRLEDPFCIAKNNGKGRCKDGYTTEVTGSEAVRVLVATKAKLNPDPSSPHDRTFYKSFLNVLNAPQNSGRFNFTTQFPFYKEVLYKPDLKKRRLGKPVVFDMDMSAGDFLALLYLLKVPVEVINLKAIIVSPNGWANAATIDIVYDILHTMGRDDIPVGLGEVFALNQSLPTYSIIGDCQYIKAIPHGSGGFLDSDTLYGLARDLPRSPRRYTAENSVKYGAPRDTDHPELRQPRSHEVWDSVLRTLDPGLKITVLTNGPLTNLAKLISSNKRASSLIQNVYIVGGHISSGHMDKGNLFSVPSNKFAEFNMFLDPLAAKTVFESTLDITLIPLSVQRSVSSYTEILKKLDRTKKTAESRFALRLLSMLYLLKQNHSRYKHMDTFLGEILGAVFLAGDHSHLSPSLQVKPIKAYAHGIESRDGQTWIDVKKGKSVKILKNINDTVYYNALAKQLSYEKQSAVIASFDEQKRKWNQIPVQDSMETHQ